MWTPIEFTVFLVSSQRSAAVVVRLGIKRLKNGTIPRNVCRSIRLDDGSMNSMESIFLGSG